jgi:hypothetical protein
MTETVQTEASTVVAVLQLHAEYARRMDGRDAEGWSRLFAGGGVFSTASREVTDPAELVAFAQTSPVGIHLAGVPTVAPQADGSVNSESNFIFVDPAKRRIVTGSYDDTLVPGGDGLRFARRRVLVLGMVDL